MPEKTDITSFEAGVLCALASLRVAIQSMPGFNETALVEMAETLKRSTAGVTDRQAFELPLAMLLSNHANIVEEMMKGTMRKADDPGK